MHKLKVLLAALLSLITIHTTAVATNPVKKALSRKGGLAIKVSGGGWGNAQPQDIETLLRSTAVPAPQALPRSFADTKACSDGSGLPRRSVRQGKLLGDPAIPFHIPRGARIARLSFLARHHGASPAREPLILFCVDRLRRRERRDAHDRYCAQNCLDYLSCSQDVSPLAD